MTQIRNENTRVAFIFSQFPRYDETFILRELNQLKSVGLHFINYSIKIPRDEIVHLEAKAMISDTHYLPFFSLRILAANCFFLLRHPVRFCRAFFKVTWGNIKSTDFLLKTLFMWPQALGFAWLARQHQITHVHGQWATHPATMALIISIMNDIDFSFTGHAHDIYLNTTMLDKKLWAAKFVTTCTTDNKRHFLSLLGADKEGDFDPARIVINYHGIDLTRFVADTKIIKPGRPFKILSVGSLLECKGYPYLIEACKILKDHGLDISCTIAGGGRLEGQLRQQVEEQGLQGIVSMTGYITQDRLIPLYQQADVFVLSMVPEIHWGIPNVLMEAMACGVPSICTQLPSIPELIQDGKTGFIVEAKSGQAIADAVGRLYCDSGLRDQVIDAGRRIVEEKFDTAKNSLQLKELFE